MTSPRHVLDLRTFLDPGGRPVPMEERERLAFERAAEIALAGSLLAPEKAWPSIVRCRERRVDGECDGRLDLVRSAEEPVLRFSCASCSGSGELTGWAESAWDLGVEPHDPEAPGYRLPLEHPVRLTLAECDVLLSSAGLTRRERAFLYRLRREEDGASARVRPEEPPQFVDSLLSLAGAEPSVTWRIVAAEVSRRLLGQVAVPQWRGRRLQGDEAKEHVRRLFDGNPLSRSEVRGHLRIVGRDAARLALVHAIERGHVPVGRASEMFDAFLELGATARLRDRLEGLATRVSLPLRDRWLASCALERLGEERGSSSPDEVQEFLHENAREWERRCEVLAEARDELARFAVAMGEKRGRSWLAYVEAVRREREQDPVTLYARMLRDDVPSWLSAWAREAGADPRFGPRRLAGLRLTSVDEYGGFRIAARYVGDGRTDEVLMVDLSLDGAAKHGLDATTAEGADVEAFLHEWMGDICVPVPRAYVAALAGHARDREHAFDVPRDPSTARVVAQLARLASPAWPPLPDPAPPSVVERVAEDFASSAYEKWSVSPSEVSAARRDPEPLRRRLQRANEFMARWCAIDGDAARAALHAALARSLADARGRPAEELLSSPFVQFLAERGELREREREVAAKTLPPSGGKRVRGGGTGKEREKGRRKAARKSRRQNRRR